MEVHVGLQNFSYSQFTTLSRRVFMRVNVRHINISAVKIKFFVNMTVNIHVLRSSWIWRHGQGT